MSSGYTYQNTIPLIGSKSGTTTTTALLTSAFAGNISNITPIGGMEVIELNIRYESERNDNLEIRVETGPDNTNMYRSVNDSTSGGTSTLTLRTFILTPTTSATLFTLPVNISNRFFRVSTRENTAGVTGSGVYVEATLSGAR